MIFVEQGGTDAMFQLELEGFFIKLPERKKKTQGVMLDKITTVGSYFSS